MSEEKEIVKCNHVNKYTRLKQDANIGGVIVNVCADCQAELETVATILNRFDFDRVHEIYALAEVGRNTIHHHAFLANTMNSIFKQKKSRIIRP